MYRRIKKYLDEELVFHIDKTIWLNKHGYGYGSFLIHTTKLTSNSAKYNPLDNLSSSQGPMNLRPTKISPRLWLHEISKFPRLWSEIMIRAKLERMWKRFNFWHICQFWRNLIKVVRFYPSKFHFSIIIKVCRWEFSEIFGRLCDIIYVLDSLSSID